MRNLILSAAAALVGSLSTASAATMTYVGFNYTDFQHSGTQENCVSSCPPYDVTGPYDASMLLELYFEVEGPILPNTYYSSEDNISADAILYPTSEPARVIQFMSGFDGVGVYQDVWSIDILTGSDRLPIMWSIEVGRRWGPDYHVGRSTDAGGDSVGYQWEFGETCESNSFFGDCNLGRRLGFENASASSSAIGQWSADDVIVTPLPASSLLYLGGLLAFRGLRRRRCAPA